MPRSALSIVWHSSDGPDADGNDGYMMEHGRVVATIRHEGISWTLRASGGKTIGRGYALVTHMLRDVRRYLKTQEVK